jgi:hypothetical protein
MEPMMEMRYTSSDASPPQHVPDNETTPISNSLEHIQLIAQGGESHTAPQRAEEEVPDNTTNTTQQHMC